MAIKTLCICSIFVSSFLHSSSWLDRKAEGWAWYEDGRTKDAQPSTSKLSTKEQKATKKMQQIKEELEEKLAEAVLEPTVSHIHAYLSMQKKWIEQSAQFSYNWARVLLEYPELDQTAISPVNQYAVQINQTQRKQSRDAELKKLGKSHALLFIFKGEEGLSSLYGSIIASFAREYEWKVIPISLNGKGTIDFPHPEKDRGITARLKLGPTPALFTIEPVAETIKPIGTGMLTVEQIKENIIRQHLGIGWEIQQGHFSF